MTGHAKGTWYLLKSGLTSFFLKIYFYYFFIGKADIQRGETERKIFHLMIHSPSERSGPILCQSEARSLFPGLPHGLRVPKLWAVLDCFPGPQAGSWKGSGAAGIEPAPIWDPGCAR